MKAAQFNPEIFCMLIIELEGVRFAPSCESTFYFSFLFNIHVRSVSKLKSKGLARNKTRIFSEAIKK